MLDELLDDMFFVEVKQRIAAGTLRIEIGANNWPDGWYIDPYRRVSVPFAIRMALACPTITLIRVYYHKPSDFHHIRFEVDGEEYIVRWYKTFILCRKSDLKQIDFGRRDYDIPETFSRGIHKRDSNHWYAQTTNHFEE